ncbi:MAG: hypothetical protein H6587_03145 [Flavobacteriales bacterium]|nr:hypothetical protein [Flavobacteriales bacterium]MCB9363544.1 hypothetical protein [Flavobacteriales bacterium]
MGSNLQAQFYNGTNVGFGKNRVQFKEFEWKYYRFEQYETYFYTGGKDLAIYTAKAAQKYLLEQEELFDFDLRDKIQFIIYNKQSDFKQSNIGLGVENGEIAGLTQIMGSKVFIYFNGSHADYDRQIKEGIATVLVNQQLYGSSWTQVLKNSSLLSVPEWYVKGLSSYMSENWNPKIENEVRDGVSSGKYIKFNRLNEQEAIVAGHSLWAYIAEVYGESVISNILYMTRITQSVDRGFLYVLGVNTKTLNEEWIAYYQQEFKNLQSKPEQYKAFEQLKIKKRREYRQFKASPNGEAFAYITDQLGQYKLYVYYPSNDKSYKIYKREFKLNRINDKSYPLLAWHPASEVLAFVTEEKGLLLMHYFDINTGGIQEKPLFNLEKVLDFSYTNDGKQMVLSALAKGQSDLYLYNVGANSQKPLTKDVFDDLNPRFIENSSQIVFTSNRTNDSLGYQPQGEELFNHSYDIWVLDINSKKLTRVTETPKQSEIQPYGIDSALYYLGEKNNVYSRYYAIKDSFITHIDTSIHYHKFYDAKTSSVTKSRGLNEHTINQNGKATEIVVDDYKYHLLFKDVNEKIDSINNLNTSLDDSVIQSNIVTKTDNYILFTPIKSAPDTTYPEINIDKYVFEKEKDKIQKNTVVIGGKDNPKDSIVTELKLPNQRNYNLSFFNDNSGIKLSNTFVNQEYQIFTGGPFTGPDVGGVMKLGVIDLFEDYRLFGGIRVSSGSREYFITYQNLVHRWDKEYTFMRTTADATNGVDVFGVTTNMLKYSSKYPFSEVANVQFTGGVRNDITVVKSIDRTSLDAKNFNEYRGVFKAAYVFDNSLPKMLNIYYGTKFKLFAEYYQEALDDYDGENGNMQVVGFDLRHSLKLSRELIWVNRIAASSSFGKEKLIYYLGSVDGWFDQASWADRFINQEDINPEVNYRFQALASNLRGFPQNIRRGSNFAVINSELRLPVFTYLIRRPIRSNFIKNFQLIGFTDAGMAWDGLDPFGKENRVTKDVITDGPLRVTVYKDIFPIVGGYGFGIRSTVLGYFLRADWAWGVEDGISKKRPVFYLSLNLDI